MYDLARVRSMVMDLVGEDSASPTYWTATNAGQLDNWINDAVEEMCALGGLYTEEIRLPLGSGRKHYWLDPGKGSQLLWVKHMRVEPDGYYVTATDTEKLTRGDYNWITRTGSPRQWYSFGLNGVRFVPYPAGEGLLIEATLVCCPPELSRTDDEVRVEQGAIAGIAAYTAAYVMIQQRRLDKAAIWYRDYLQSAGVASADPMMRQVKTLMPRSLELGGERGTIE